MPTDPTQHVHTHAAVTRVRETLAAAGLADTITVMPEATHTALAAADALGSMSVKSPNQSFFAPRMGARCW